MPDYNDLLMLDSYSPEPLYNTVRFNTVLDKTDQD